MGETCPRCKGTGGTGQLYWEVCEDCKGHGEVTAPVIPPGAPKGPVSPEDLLAEVITDRAVKDGDDA